MRFMRPLIIVALFLVLAACGKSETATPTPQQLNVDADDVTLFVRIAGNAEAENVLIVTGSMMFSSHPMTSLDALAGSDFAVVTYDPRGVGRSTQPSPSPANYDLPSYVSDLEAVRQATGAETVHLLGIHWGGVVAMRYATLYPERVDSLILWGSLGPSSLLFGVQASTYSNRVAQLQRQGVLPKTLPGLTCASSLKEYLPVAMSDPGFELPAQWEAVQCSDTALVMVDSNISTGFDITPELANLSQRVLILYGEDDPHGGASIGKAIKSSMPAAQVELITLEKCGHLWDECPTEFFSHIRDFLSLPEAPAS
jgi:pimeloyl-ACP methyl ester carboxylesterase